MECNPDDFKDSPKPMPKVAKLDFRFIPDQQTQLAEVLAGGLDLTWDVPPEQAARARDAIDREAMLKSLVGEGGWLLHTMCHPVMFGCTDSSAPRYTYDPAKAKQLLAEAGDPKGFDLEFHAYRDRAQTEAMIGYLRAVGISRSYLSGAEAAVSARHSGASGGTPGGRRRALVACSNA